MKNPWTLETARTEISAPTLTWEIVGNGVNEGPEILISPAGKVFLVFSASGCWTDEYTIGMLQLKDGGDPLKAPDWIKLANPFLVKKPENQAYAPGHCSFFKSPDGKEDWIVYHANSAPNQGCDVFRNPRIQKFTWNADGTPHFGEPVKINTPITKPSGEQ
jgi:GH43 family beta-xylosidase